MFERNLKNRRGFTLVGAIIAMALLSVFILGTVAVQNHAVRAVHKDNVTFGVGQIRQIFSSLFFDRPNAWVAIRNLAENAPVFSPCVAPASCQLSDFVGAGHPDGRLINLVNADGTDFYKAALVTDASRITAVATAGFNLKGGVCNDFSNTSLTCPVHVRVWVRPDCDVGCQTPMVWRVTVRYFISQALISSSNILGAIATGTNELTSARTDFYVAFP